KEADSRLKNIERVLRLQQRYQTDWQSRMVSLEKKMSEEELNSRVKNYAQNQMKALEQSAEHTVEYMSTLLTTEQLHQRLLDEIFAKGEHIPLWDKLVTSVSKLQNFWSFELWVMDEHSVTVKKVIYALIVLIIGVLLIRFGIRITRRHLLPRTSLGASAAAAIEKMLYYFGLFLIVLFALRIVNIPLTAFAFLGGAVAIGVGFGAQTLINNFISGFIIMAEQPIKIGDLIEMEGNYAVVEEIGARCTRIRTFANIHMLVPNSSFLEKNIINWTLSDHNIRGQVTVGVAYGSPAREVKRLMLKAVKDHGKILTRPEPYVFFSDFGDNALIFNVYFWIGMSRLMERWTTESDIRFRIDALFQEAGIVIAFPQLDVHFDTKTPLQLQIRDNK
ncbi:MAG: mechanosensitive ion channel, partial [Thermodesulfobacteriota bacterium]|nr:mechanosensitive ion channel [Thermodesulfobacteriota bacterium]